MSYIHLDVLAKQSSKHYGEPCGDVWHCDRDQYSTTVILSDGLGHGVKANIAANLCVSRLSALIKNGVSIREAFSSLTRTMNKAWGTDDPFAVFTIARMLNNGEITVLSYEMPPPILLWKYSAVVMADRTYSLEKAVVSETQVKIDLGEGILLMSDGITQAGLGRGLAYGWESKGVADYVTRIMANNQHLAPQDLVNNVHDKALELWGAKKGDDCTALFAKCRKGIVISVLTGPPADKSKDSAVIKDFMEGDDIKIICGGSTAKFAARELGETITLASDTFDSVTPPYYKIDGIDLVTEGVVTLKQVYNLMDEEIDYSELKSPLKELMNFFAAADRVNFYIGDAPNLDDAFLDYRRQGIFPRKKILPLIIDKLKASGKLVVIKNV